MSNNNAQKLHIVMLPWLAFGHMNPYLELAKQIVRRGHRVSFISTPRNIDRLLLKSPENLEEIIDFVRIPLPTVENLPEDVEATTDLPYDRMPFLKIAYDLLREPVARFLDSARPDWIMYDFAPYWVGPMAAEFGIRRAFLTIYTAVTVAFLGPTWAMLGGDYRKTMEDFTVSPEWVPPPAKVAFRYHEIKKIFDAFEGNVSGVSDVYRIGSGVSSADVIMMRGSYEFDPEWLKLVEDEIHRKPVFPFGQLPPIVIIKEEVEDEVTWMSIKRWLDTKKKGSVIYIAFGSEAKPSQRELTEMAHGLERSGLSFFWVFRARLGPSDPEPVSLPDGFENRVAGRGLVYTGWAPQQRILGHDSVGGFLTHCGWSSVVEALSLGKALILFPLLYDQGFNARVLEEKGIGYAIPRNESDGWFTWESVAKTLRLVMVEEEGKAFREKAKEMMNIFASKEIQDGCVDRFLNYFKENRPEKK